MAKLLKTGRDGIGVFKDVTDLIAHASATSFLRYPEAAKCTRSVDVYPIRYWPEGGYIGFLGRIYDLLRQAKATIDRQNEYARIVVCTCGVQIADIGQELCVGNLRKIEICVVANKRNGGDW